MQRNTTVFTLFGDDEPNPTQPNPKRNKAQLCYVARFGSRNVVIKFQFVHLNCLVNHCCILNPRNKHIRAWQSIECTSNSCIRWMV